MYAAHGSLCFGLHVCASVFFVPAKTRLPRRHGRPGPFDRAQESYAQESTDSQRVGRIAPRRPQKAFGSAQRSTARRENIEAKRKSGDATARRLPPCVFINPFFDAAVRSSGGFGPTRKGLLIGLPTRRQAPNGRKTKGAHFFSPFRLRRGCASFRRRRRASTISQSRRFRRPTGRAGKKK